MPLGQTYTGQQGAIAQLQNRTGAQYGTKISAPPPQAQPVADQTQEPAPQPQVQGPTPYYGGQTQNPEDVQRLVDIRSQMIDQLFAHDQGLSQQYANPQKQNFVPNALEQYRADQIPERASLGMLSALNDLISSQRGKANQRLSPTEQKQLYLQQLSDELATTGATPDLLPQYMQKYRTVLSPNEIVDTFQTNAPNQQIPYEQLQAYGYKPPTTLAKTAANVSQAQLALQEIAALDKASKDANTFGSMILQIPGLAQGLSAYNPAANYEASRQQAAQRITKLLYGSNYPGVASNILEAIPHAYGTEDIRQSNLATLRQQAQDVIDQANAENPQFSFGGPSAASNVAQGPAPQTTAYKIEPITTSSGNTISVIPGGM